METHQYLYLVSFPGKVKHLERESHKRERSMARVAQRAGGGELGVLTADGSVLAMREAFDRVDQWPWWVDM